MPVPSDTGDGAVTRAEGRGVVGIEHAVAVAVPLPVRLADVDGVGLAGVALPQELLEVAHPIAIEVIEGDVVNVVFGSNPFGHIVHLDAAALFGRAVDSRDILVVA